MEMYWFFVVVYKDMWNKNKIVNNRCLFGIQHSVQDSLYITKRYVTTMQKSSAAT